MNAFENFVKIQSDAALRQVAGQYAYDDNEADTEELTLRSGGEEIMSNWNRNSMNALLWQVWKWWKHVSTIWLMHLK